jgi:hypothetical protein
MENLRIDSPNGQDQLPGRLMQLHFSQDRNSGPVNCIRSFDKNNLESRFFWPIQAAPRIALRRHGE